MGNSTTRTLLFLAAFGLNFFWWQSPFLGAALLLFFLLHEGSRLGFCFGVTKTRTERVFWGTAAFLGLIAVIGSGLYYADLLVSPSIAALVAILPWMITMWQTKKRIAGTETRPEKIPTQTQQAKKGITKFGILAFVIFCSALGILLAHPITEAVRSPWLIVPPIFFVFVFVFALLLISRPSALRLMGFTTLTVGVAFLVYPLGFGFDPFLHQATENHIALHGSIEPKPLYYAGQYALTLFSSLGFFLPIPFLDRLLLPLLTPLFLPLALWFGFRRRAMDRAPLALFLVPLSSFIVTTPQGLANLWLLLAMASSFSRSFLPPYRLFLPWVFALASFLTHPLAGLAACLWNGFILIRKRAGRVTISLAACSVFLYPAVFFLYSRWTDLPWSFAWNGWPKPARVTFFFQNRFHPFWDAVYLWSWNHVWILLALSAAGLWILFRRRQKNSAHAPLYPLSFLLAIILFTNDFLLRAFTSFDFVASYEQHQYADRVFESGLFFLLPTISVALGSGLWALQNKPRTIRWGAFALLAGVLTIGVYTTYPRHNPYETGRGFNVAASDFSAVEYIHEKEKGGADYVVLANQAVSAAAARRYGFLKYFDGEIFYYALPTSGPLYQIYLAMVNEEPSRERAAEAARLAGVSTVYFVVNDYWFEAQKIIELAKTSADHWVGFDRGSKDDNVFVFQYHFSKF